MRYLRGMMACGLVLVAQSALFGGNCGCCLPPIEAKVEVFGYCPVAEDTDFAILVENENVLNPFASGQLKGICPKMKAGFRLTAQASFCCCNPVYISWLRLHNSFSKRVNEVEDLVLVPGLIPTIGRPTIGLLVTALLADQANARLTFKLDTIDLGYELCCFDCGCGSIEWDVGLRGMRVYRDLSVTFTGGTLPELAADTASVSSESWGIGPFFAGRFCTKLCCLDLCVRGLVSCLGGSYKAWYNDLRPIAPTILETHLRFDGGCKTFSTVECNIELSYPFCWCGYEGSVGLAYEAARYFSAVQSIQFYNIVGDGAAHVSVTDTGYSALVGSFALCF